MADTTIISLTETTSPTKDDVAVIVDNPSTSTPSNRKITLNTLHSKLYWNNLQSVENLYKLIYYIYSTLWIYILH